MEEAKRVLQFTLLMFLYATKNLALQLPMRGRSPRSSPLARFLTVHQHMELQIPTTEDMEDLGGLICSMGMCAGDVLLLKGGLGSGKTCFARGFVRAATGDEELRVTSPTYLLSNSYSAAQDDLT